MFDLSSEFISFYKNYVVLPQSEQTELTQKKDLNIQRLKDGLAEYNQENKTSYKIIDTCVQGSMAMSTIVQNEDNDYDIDIAVVFDSEDVKDLGAQATRNIVGDALKRKTKSFNIEPEIKTSCVRVTYADGYHIDFAIYKEEGDETYYHAGAQWSNRDLNGLTQWFKKQNDDCNGKLRKVVRLSKMFCTSRDTWKNMPSGLIQTVVCHETLSSNYERIDELFYHTMEGIVSRLENDVSVMATVDNGRLLTVRKSDEQKVINWKNRLKSKLEDLDILFSNECDKNDALQAWYGFFNHEFWSQKESDSSDSVQTLGFTTSVGQYNDTEEFIEDKFPVNISYSLSVSCEVSADGFRKCPLDQFLARVQGLIPHNQKIFCSVSSTSVPKPYEVLWKVKNVGPEAERRNDIRGQINKRGTSITESTVFRGNHYIECYIIKYGCCMARRRIEVPIGKK